MMVTATFRSITKRQLKFIFCKHSIFCPNDDYRFAWSYIVFLARSAKLPTGLYILPMFFFFILFFNGRLSSPRNSEPNGPIFTKISRLVEGCGACSTHWAFLTSTGTLPWQPTKVEKSVFLTDQSHLSHCHSKRDCNIAIPISKD